MGLIIDFDFLSTDNNLLALLSLRKNALKTTLKNTLKNTWQKT